MANKHNVQYFRINFTLHSASTFHEVKILFGNKYLLFELKLCKRFRFNGIFLCKGFSSFFLKCHERKIFATLYEKKF